MDVSGKLHTLAALPLQNNPSNRWIGDWVGLGPARTLLRKEKSLTHNGIPTPDRPVSMPTILPILRNQYTAFPGQFLEVMAWNCLFLQRGFVGWNALHQIYFPAFWFLGVHNEVKKKENA
jgi:hypothetical protein